MKRGSTVTVWFGKEVNVEQVRATVKKLYSLGFSVRAPFYIGYNIDTHFVKNYLQNSLDISDYLYIIGYEGSLLEDIIEYANEKGKPIVREDIKELCCQL